MCFFYRMHYETETSATLKEQISFHYLRIKLSNTLFNTLGVCSKVEKWLDASRESINCAILTQTRFVLDLRVFQHIRLRLDLMCLFLIVAIL